jgi:oligopeptide transport system substrate-binding protein
MRFILLALLCICCFSCSGLDNTVQNSIRINSRTEPSSIDPRKAVDLPSSTISKALFEGLMRLDVNGDIIPALAQTVDVSSDGRIYTFHLRESLWTNGEDVTAYDFEYAIKSALDPNFIAPSVHQLYVVKNARNVKNGLKEPCDVGVHAEDNLTLVIELENPTPYFLELTAKSTRYLPINRTVDAENTLWARGSDYFVSNGPFKLASWHHGDDLTVLKNENYWDSDIVQIEQITFTMIEDEHTEFNMFESGELDWAGSPLSSLPPDSVYYLKKEGRLQMPPMAEIYLYKFNTQAVPFNNVKMRRAFSYALNRKEIIDNILQADHQVATGIIPPMMLDKPQDYYDDNDVKTAQRLFNEALKEMNMTKKDLPPLVLDYIKSEKHHKIAQTVQQQWEQAFGIEIQLSVSEWNFFLSKLRNHDFQIAGRGWVADFNDPIGFLEVYKYLNEESLGASNDTQWKNEKFTNLLNEAASCADPLQRKKILAQAEEILVEDMPVAPLFHATISHLVQDRVKDIVISATCNLDFRWAYIVD